MNALVPNHPAFVHFPLGLLATAFLFELLGLALRRPSMHDLGRGALYLGTLTALVAVGTGLWAEELVEPAPRGLAALLEVHKTLAVVVAALAVVLSMWRVALRRRYDGGRRALFVAALGALAAAVLWTGHVGGRMVYDHGAGVTVGRRSLGAKPLPSESWPGAQRTGPGQPGRRDGPRKKCRTAAESDAAMSYWTRTSQVVLAVLYFAYGSNMNWTQMRQRCPDARFQCVAALRDHRLAFTRTSERWQGGGVADVAPDSGKVVWGVVYEVGPADLDSLDRFEGFQEGRAANDYTRGKIRVLDRGRSTKPLEVWAYRAVPQGEHFAPSSAYRDTVVAGAKHWKLPELYVEDLERIPVKK